MGPTRRGKGPKWLVVVDGQGVALGKHLASASPHRRGWRKQTQDGRKLRRYRRRWIGERTFAWLGNSRRLVVRYERKLQIYSAFFHFACIMIVLDRL